MPLIRRSAEPPHRPRPLRRTSRDVLNPAVTVLAAVALVVTGADLASAAGPKAGAPAAAVAKASAAPVEPGSKPHPYLPAAPSAEALRRARDAAQAPADFGPGEKVVKAWYAHQISTDQLVRYGYASVFAPDQVPADLRPGRPLGEQTAPYLSFISGHASEATPETRARVQGITDSLKATFAAPARAKAASNGVSIASMAAGATTNAKVKKAATSAPATAFGDDFCTADPVFDYPTVSGVAIHQYHCVMNTPHFLVFYNHGEGLPETPGDQGAPTAVWAIARAAEEAYGVYSTGTIAGTSVQSLGFPAPSSQPISILIGDALHDVGAFAPDVAATLPIGPNDSPSIWMPPSPTSYDALVRHELAHAFQYQYLPNIGFDLAAQKFTGDLGSENWWMEASAQWATDESYRLDPGYAYARDWPGSRDPRWPAQDDGDNPKQFYAKNLLGFLGTTQQSDGTTTINPHRAINAWDGLAGDRPYGVFPLAEYLTELSQQFSGPPDYSAVRHTWEKVGGGALPLDAITETLSGYGYDVDQAFLNFAVANYRLGTPSALSQTIPVIPADGYTEPDASTLWSGKLGGRPALDQATQSALGVLQNDTIGGVGPGGQGYADFAAPQLTGPYPAGTGRALSLTLDPTRYKNVTWELVAWQQKTASTPVPTMVAKPDPATGTATIVLAGASDAVGSLPYVTVVMTRTDFKADSSEAGGDSLDLVYQHIWQQITGVTVDGPQVQVPSPATTAPTLFAFACTAGQTVYANGSTSNSGLNTRYHLFDASGVEVQSGSEGGTIARQAVLAPVKLKSTGTCLVRVDPPNAGGGTLTLQVFGSFLTAAATVDGAPVSVTIPTTAPGKRAKFTFSGKAGQTVYVNGTVTGGFDTYDTLYDPSGNVVATSYQGGYTTPQSLLKPTKLPVAGTYTFELDPPPADSGTLKVQVFGSFVTRTATIGGAAVTATIPSTTPGKRANISFAATPGQRVSVYGSSTLPGTNTYYYLLDPTGMQIASGSTNTTTAKTIIAATTLPTAGTYIIQVVPLPTSSGTATLQVKTA